MSVLAAAQFVTVVDKIAAGLYAIKGSESSGYGAGDITQALASDWGLSLAMRNLENAILGTPSVPGFGDYSEISAWIAPVHNMQNVAPYTKLAATLFASLVQTLDSEARRAALNGVTDSKTFAAYYNTGAGGPYHALVSPEYADLWNNVLNPATPLDAFSVYAPCKAGDPLLNMGQMTFGGSLSLGATVDTTKYAGAANIEANITGYSGTSGALTVTGSARKADGSIVAGRTFTGAVASTPASQTVALSPSVAGDLLTAVSGITLPGGMTGGTVVVVALPPTGRVAPPSP